MDTFLIVLSVLRRHITDPTKFTPSFRPYKEMNEFMTKVFRDEHKGVRTFRQNPSLERRAEGLVYPNLTIYERMRGSVYSLDLHIQMSLPKGLFGESIHEFTEKDLERYILLLILRLRDMGVELTVEEIKSARVTTAHYGKNIMCESEKQMLDIVHKLSLCSLGQWYEANTRDYANDGYAVRFHSKVFQMVFYHKYRDLLSSSTSIDNHKTRQEKELAKQALVAGQIPPLLRYEVRLNGPTSIRRRMNEVLGVDKSHWTFEELVKDDICSKILATNWQRLTAKPENMLILQDVDNVSVATKVHEEFHEYPPRNVAEGMGYYFFLQNLGVKKLRDGIVDTSNRQAWYRTVKKIVVFAQKCATTSSKIVDFINEKLGITVTEPMLPL